MTRKHVIRLGKHRLPLPGSWIVRMFIGVILILGGFLGFLPILGFWMIPLGLMVLSIDLPIVRRGRRRIEVWWGNRRKAQAAKRAAQTGKKTHKEK
jgi:purine-cytosine permease-like protein